MLQVKLDFCLSTLDSDCSELIFFVYQTVDVFFIVCFSCWHYRQRGGHVDSGGKSTELSASRC